MTEKEDNSNVWYNTRNKQIGGWPLTQGGKGDANVYDDFDVRITYAAL